METITQEGLDVRWRVEAGLGYAGPAVAGGKVFLSDYIKTGLPLTLVCLGIVLLVLPIFWPLIP